jgi:hypothetical protein
VPVIIHLWNIRKGRVLRVGSTLLMNEATQKRSTSLQISDWLLLILRCLLIIVLSFILAGAFWQTTRPGGSKGWVLIEPSAFPLIYNNHQQRIDSLLKNGFELHAFLPEFPGLQIRDTATADTSGAGEPYWSLIRRLDHKLPSRFPVYLFTGNQLNKLALQKNEAAQQAGMPRPTVSIDLHWVLTKVQMPSNEIELSSRQLPGGKYESLVLHTTDDGSYLRNKTVPGATNADTSTKRIAVIYETKYQQDARFVEAALKSIAAFGNYKMDISVSSDHATPTSGLNWLFWLSDKQLSVPPARHNFVYMTGEATPVRSWLREEDGGTRGDDPDIFRLIKDSISTKHPATWQDGFGNPVLTLDRDSGIYRFYSRLDPNWTDLPWNPQFPRMLLQLISEEPVIADGRTFDLTDALPVNASETIKSKETVYEVLELQKILWFITFLLFATERIISINRTKPGKI